MSEPILDPEFVALLGNPLEPDRPPLRQEGDYLVCTRTGVAFPIVNGVPDLLPESALTVDEYRARRTPPAL